MASPQTCLRLRRQDFQPGDPPWQEHPDDTFARPTSWVPGPKWIYQVLLKLAAESVTWATMSLAAL